MRARTISETTHLKIKDKEKVKAMQKKSKNSQLAVSIAICMAVSVLGGISLAMTQPPEEHTGLEVEQLAIIPPESISSQLGVNSYKMLARKITILPGGQIAKHSHASSPGIVHMVTGTWTEGRESGEVEYSTGDTFIEDKDTVHWFYNRGDVPATALVFDLKPS